MEQNRLRLTARAGFLCALVIIILTYIPNQILWICYRNVPACAEWLQLHPNLTQGALMLLECGISLLVAILFSKARSTEVFLARVGLQSQPGLSGWSAALTAAGIGVLANYGTSMQWIQHNYVSDFFQSGGVAKWFFIIYGIVLAPFSEEVVRRGYLYPAFRSSFNPLFSTCLLVCFDAYFHWGIIAHSLYTFMCLALMWILLCAIRELTGSLWNCVLCHAMYNATQAMPWSVVLIVMMIVLPLCINWNKHRGAELDAPAISTRDANKH